MWKNGVGKVVHYLLQLISKEDTIHTSNQTQSPHKFPPSAACQFQHALTIQFGPDDLTALETTPLLQAYAAAYKMHKISTYFYNWVKAEAAIYLEPASSANKAEQKLSENVLDFCQNKKDGHAKKCEILEI